MSYGWLFENPDDEISGDIYVFLEHLPPELKQVALQIVQNQIDRDTAEKKLAELIGDGRENGQNRTLSMRPVRLRP
ncbi:hypothetical protein F1D92_25985 [Klebsiella pneumoniae]|uniref:hypothetical protein n=1 Tax=Klebsiella pneumoniae TaxID=573 RepID=UPI00122CDE35|nr:hypothetical protein [Klebsiella pneumoniae]KAA1733661.1 hypothetical protein F1D92_25985 [Klebsiella pneumoniae]